MLSAASAWSSCSSAKLIRSTSLTPGLAVALRADPGNSGSAAEVEGAVMPRVVSSSRAHIQLACACASSTSSVPEAAVGNEAGAGAVKGGSLLAALFRAASSRCVSLSQSVSDSHRRVKAFPQSQRCRLLMLAFRRLLAGGAGPSTGRGLFVVAELARGGRAGGGSAEGAGAEAGSRPNATSTPRRNCAEFVAKVSGAREGLDGLHSAGWAGFAARYALPAGDA